MFFLLLFKNAQKIVRFKYNLSFYLMISLHFYTLLISSADPHLIKTYVESVLHLPLHFINNQFNVSASLAQGLEHWSCKPGVQSSNL